MRRSAAFCLAVSVALVSYGTRGLSADRSAEDVGRIEAATAGLAVKGAEVAAPTPNTPVQSGDVVRTGPTSSGRLALSGGGSILLQPNTELRVVKHDPSGGGTTIDLARGQVLAQAPPDARDGTEFRIETPTAVVATTAGSVVVRTAPDPISLGMMTLSLTVANGAAPVADAPVTVVVQGVDEALPAGKTNAGGEADVVLDYVKGAHTDLRLAYPLIDWVRFIRQDFQAVVQTCDDGRREIFLTGENGRLPDEPKKCRRQKMGGAFVWNGRKRVGIDAGARTLQATDMKVEPAPRTAIGTTVATAFHGLVWLAGRSTGTGVTYLLPGQTAAADAGGRASSAVRFDHAQLLVAAGLRIDREQWILPAVLTDFTAAGKPCEPVWVLDGLVAKTRARFDIEINGTGTSTGNAFAVHATNEWDCAVYFMVTDGTILHAKGTARRVVRTLFTGAIPAIGNFQRMMTAGIFWRVPPGAKDQVHLMRAYCMELEKLAPHARTEYQVSGEDEQRLYGWRRPIVDNGFSLVAMKRLVSTTGHTVDSLIQWSLWTRIEGLDERKFAEEFTKLVRKNYEAQKKRWDDAAKKTTAASAADMWKLIQVIAPQPAR